MRSSLKMVPQKPTLAERKQAALARLMLERSQERQEAATQRHVSRNLPFFEVHKEYKRQPAYPFSKSLIMDGNNA